jgi:hypothetical protein
MPTPGLVGQYELTAVLALSPTDVWAGGGSNSLAYGTTVPRELFEHWDGSQWSVVPGAGVPNGAINALAGVSGDDVWAIGTYQPVGSVATLTEHWNGRRWSLVPNPIVAGTLVSVVALEANDVLVYGRGDGIGGFVERWNGSTWSVSPRVSDGFGQMAATSDNDIWIADGQTTPHWDGTSWSDPSVPDVNGDPVGVYSVALTPTAGPWAGGGKGLGGGHPEVQAWNGSGWAEAPVTGLSSDTGHWAWMSAASSSDVWTVGQQYVQSSNQDVTAAAHWDGTQWTSVPPLNPSGVWNGFASVSALPGQVWAAGTWIDPTVGDAPLIETYCA